MGDLLGVGIIGCGNISAAYLELGAVFKGYDVRAVADLDLDRAHMRAAEFGVRAGTVDDVLAADDIDLVINLTTPAAHFDVSRAILMANKHVYSEKPFVLTLADAQDLNNLAAANGLRIGSAPDTFLGGAHQLARKLLDEGAIGKVMSGVCSIMSSGAESWHPNPDFFYKAGGGPVLDMGPYYICNLVQMLGPVSAVTSVTGAAHATRTIGSGPRAGQQIEVETPTTLHAVLRFESGSIITLLSSWDVWSHNQPMMELYGTQGTMVVPDPNFFGGPVTASDHEGPAIVQTWDHPFGTPNFDSTKANYRGAGLADMVAAMATGRPHRCNNIFATHVIEVLTAILKAGETRSVIQLTTTCDRPDALSTREAQALMV